MFSKILCPVDFGEFTSTQVNYARSFADFEHAKLTFVHVIEPKLKMYGFAPLKEVENQLYDNAKEKLLNFCGTDPDARIVFGSAAAEIAQIADKELFELIIMPTHGYKGIKKIFLGSTFQAVINKTNCFVLALTPLFLKSENDSLSIKPGRILCGIDLKRRSSKLCHITKRLSEAFGVDFFILHCIDLQHEVERFFSSESFEEMGKRVYEDVLAENPCAFHAREILIRRGDPSEKIIECMSEKSAHFLILGFSHPSTHHLRTTLFRTVARSDAPVLCVPVE